MKKKREREAESERWERGGREQTGQLDQLLNVSGQ